MKKNRIILIACILISIVLIGVSVTFAYTFIDSLAHNREDALASTATIKLKYTDCLNADVSACSDISAELAPGDSISKEFSVTNVGTKQAQYTLYFRELYNTFVNGDLVYTLENLTTDEVLILEQAIPRGTNDNKTILSDIVAPVNASTNYRLTVKYLNRDYNQIDNIDAEFSLKLGIRDGEAPLKNELIAVTNNYTDKMWEHKAKITKIVFENSMNPKENANYTYDISNGQDESVMSYLIANEDDTTKYTAYIQTDGQIIANRNSEFLFSGFTELQSIEGLDNLNTSNATTIRDMFGGCSKLTSLDLSNFDTSSVTNMQGLFWKCSSLTTLDLSSFDTSNVTNMQGIFHYCEKLETLDLANFNTSKVITMSSLFSNCNKLKAVNVSTFDTSNVTIMNNMFSNCQSLMELDLSNFNTGNVTTMSEMFKYCKNLKSLDISSFNTSKVNNMAYMFNGCINLITLDVSSFNTSNVNNMNSMFGMQIENENPFGKIEKIIGLENFDTSKVTNMAAMFDRCERLTTINVSGFNTSKVTTMQYMFSDCRSLIELDLSNFDTSNVTNINWMFGRCINLEYIDISNFNTSKVTNMANLFNMWTGTENAYGKLKEISGLEHFDTSNVINMTGMFASCGNLETLDLANFNTSKVTDMNNLFAFCGNLKTLNISNFNTGSVTNMSYMFKECKNLRSLDIADFDTSNVTNMYQMFHGSDKLTDVVITIRGTKCTNYVGMFAWAATEEGSSVTVNYTQDASTLVDNMIATKNSNSNVIKGIQVA